MTIDITTTQVTAIVAAAIIVVDLVIRVIAVIVVPRNRRPTAGMAWLLAIFFFPVLGGLIFLLIGNPKLPKRRREKQAEVDEFIRESTHGIERVSESSTWPTSFEASSDEPRPSGRCRSSARTARASSASTRGRSTR